MKMGIIGTHFTGKTELAEELYTFLKQHGKDVVLIKETARRCPLPLNKDATFEAQTWVLAEQIKQEIESTKHEITISDRSVIDNYAYSLWKFPDKARTMLNFIIEYSKTYDHIFKTTPLDVPIEPDGYRSTDPVFRNEIEKIISDFLHEHSIQHKLLPEENTLKHIKEVLGYEND
ncbi:MAG: ATP-binding protein [Nanoarchaeota archaeon]|nr:ATP-binding protein [Nanoarchaeota archaeon]